MVTHVKAVGWLWIAWGVLTFLMAVPGLIIISANIPDAGDSLLVIGGSLFCIVPGFIADIIAGYGLLRYKSWARILAIILSILSLILFPIGTAIGIYTLWVLFRDETKELFQAGK